MKHALLTKLNACEDAVEWASQHKTLQAAWDACPRGDWMLWLAGTMSGAVGSPARRKLVLATTECARLSLKYVRECDRAVVLKCYETAEAYGRGEDGVALGDVSSAALAVHTAYVSVSAPAYASSGAAAAYAAMAAYAGYASSVAAYAGGAACGACTACDAGSVARKSVLAECANIVRTHYPKVPRR